MGREYFSALNDTRRKTISGDCLEAGRRRRRTLSERELEVEVDAAAVRPKRPQAVR
jgi:hypothetical protein